ncbi:SET domain-containing protein [Tothia fuscella]|uniref:SET domain-containing protein n=1 Tax=Tothia fuscella TaxID=1048955 RepID=A0A9P4TT57_9PEZI|nr:SET domain-containing protein [Tothia fuscella]
MIIQIGLLPYLIPFAYAQGSTSIAPGFASWPTTDQACSGPPEVYTVRPSPGKGLGVFALHDLDVGSIIMRETPIFTIQRPSFIKGTGYPMEAVSQLVRSEFALLASKQQEEVMNLTYHATDTEKENSDVLGLIFRSNAYKTGEDIGLFPKISRINHSCRPNTSYYWNAKQNKRIVYANRKIRKGEELFDSYISLLLTHKERKERLEPYGFTCSCPACASKPKAMRESDVRRMDIRKAFADFASQLTLTVPDSQSARRKARINAKASLQLNGLVQQEALADFYAHAYKIVAISHARAEDWGAATTWSNRGYELRVMEDPESANAMEMFQLTSAFIERWKDEMRQQSL